MKEIVQKILETEKEVRESIDRAHADAQDVVRKAEDESQTVDERFRQEAMHEAQQITERMKREAEAERERMIESAHGGSAELLKKKSAEIKAASDRVLRLLLGIERR